MRALDKRLPFYPMPYEDELFKGYVLRLAFENCWDELSLFLSFFEIAANAKNIFVIGTGEHSQFLDIISQTMAIDSTELAAFFSLEKEIQQLDKQSNKYVYLNHPRICPFCISKNGQLKRDWHLFGHTHCYEHECKLWDHCYFCKKKFSWHGKLFKGCTNCTKKWDRFSFEEASLKTSMAEPLPSSQRALSQSHGAHKVRLMKTLFDNIKFGVRPFDASIKAPRDLCLYVDDMTTHVEFTYQLIHSSEVLEKLKQERKQHWQRKISGPEHFALFNKIDAVNDDIFEQIKPSSIAFSGSSLTPKEASYMVLTPHRRINTTAEKACLELTWDYLEIVLLISEINIKSMIREGILPGRMHIKPSKKAWAAKYTTKSIDKLSPSRIDDVVNFYREIKKRALPFVAANDDQFYSDFIAWGNDDALRKYKLNTSKLAKYILDGQLPIYGPAHYDHLFEDFHFCRKSLDKRFGNKSANTSDTESEESA
ncbi:MAG: TniQ family protein [Paraglaciecola sp.]|nr:TniQ family protein [Paraglaciecola sp.]